MPITLVIGVWCALFTAREHHGILFSTCPTVLDSRRVCPLASAVCRSKGVPWMRHNDIAASRPCWRSVRTGTNVRRSPTNYRGSISNPQILEHARSRHRGIETRRSTISPRRPAFECIYLNTFEPTSTKREHGPPLERLPPARWPQGTPSHHRHVLPEDGASPAGWRRTIGRLRAGRTMARNVRRDLSAVVSRPFALTKARCDRAEVYFRERTAMSLRTRVVDARFRC